MWDTGYELLNQIILGIVQGYALIWLLSVVPLSTATLKEQWEWLNEGRTRPGLHPLWRLVELPLFIALHITAPLLRPFMLIFLHTFVALMELTVLRNKRD